ncbi:MAG: UvrD-helicase domain-containing protein [Clostridia bacterium]|nr:UvrD-helicase domain-containing protein [Clostridia bacterium]
MCLIKKLIEKHKQIVAEHNDRCNDLISRLNEAYQIADRFIVSTIEYVDLNLAYQWQNKYSKLKLEVAVLEHSDYKKADPQLREQLLSLIEKFNNLYITLPDKLRRHNVSVDEYRLNKAYLILGNVEGKKPDRQQMLAIMNNDRNHLIIAGAGTGKTTTVVGKIKYLLLTQQCKPEDILVLSFTNASASEMSKRISNETQSDIAASTFHKLGLNIMTKVERKKPKITHIDLHIFIKDTLKTMMQDSRYLHLISSYLLDNRVKSKSEFDFKNYFEYREYLRLNPPLTFKNETVKSYGEMEIANFLYRNKIAYKYEETYKVDTRTTEYGQYHPDFYLPEYDLYIEYFGIDRNGNVPSWFDCKNGMSASETYQASMEWKRKIHKNNGTTLIECYSYEIFENTLLPEFERKLNENGVKLSPMSSQELWSTATKGTKSVLDGVIELFETVINLMKSNNLTVESFRALVSNTKDANCNRRFIDLIEPVFNKYEEELVASGEIDFNDMINTAAEYVRSGRYKNPYSYVIVDEYQDISKARFSLLYELRRSKDYNLFCVGDDWQSIYRFAGSDISYILDFKKYWGATTTSFIETTYRFSQSLINISGSFIMKNPHQIKKSIIGKSTSNYFSLGEVFAYNEKNVVDYMAERVLELPRNSTVFFIGRYSFDIDIIDENDSFDCHYNNVTGFTDVRYYKRPDLKISFLTAHRSKGLQADYVFIINNKSSRMGFPSKIQDDSILDLLLDNSDDFPYAEERRLYYVALTRAKTKAFFLTIKDKESVFAQELHSKYEDQLKKERFECPQCGGRLVRKEGQFGEFWGCENYKSSGCKFTRNIRWKSPDGDDSDTITKRTQYNNRIPYSQNNNWSGFAAENTNKSENKPSGRTENNKKVKEPDGAGARWSKSEDKKLIAEYKTGMKISEIAKAHSRTYGAIRARLKKHKLI